MQFRLDYQSGEGPTLDGVGAGPTWNGFRTPIASARAFRNFLEACSANDPNGTWSECHVYETTTRAGRPQLVLMQDGYDEPDTWGPPPAAFVGPEQVYLLDGWTWQYATEPTVE